MVDCGFMVATSGRLLIVNGGSRRSVVVASGGMRSVVGVVRGGSESGRRPIIAVGGT